MQFGASPTTTTTTTTTTGQARLFTLVTAVDDDHSLSHTCCSYY